MVKLYLIGSDYHCGMVRDLLESEKEIQFVNEIDNADLMYVVYGPGVSKSTLKFWVFSKKNILIHWIGKDTFIFHKDQSNKSLISKIHRYISLMLIRYRNKRNSLKFISSAPWLAEEVTQTSKINTDYLVLTSIENESLLEPSNTREFDMISYIPVNDFDMYYGIDFLEIIKSNRERKFCIVCPDIKSIDEWPYEQYENLTIQPRTDKNGFLKLINRSKVFIRLKDGGDAIALSVLEALAHGTRVVWNLKFDYCDYETRESFKQNYKKYFYDDFKVNYDSVEFIKKQYDVEKWKLDFKKLVNTLNK